MADINIYKTSLSKELDICHYRKFSEKNLEF